MHNWLSTLYSAIVLNRQCFPVFHPYNRAQIHTRKGTHLNQCLSPSWQFPELLDHNCVALPLAKLIAGLQSLDLFPLSFGKRGAC